MTQLEKLYQTIQNLKELGLPIGEELIGATDKLEEEIIQQEILPVLAEKVAPIMEQIRRDMVIVIEYVPDEPISVRLTRKDTVVDSRSYLNVDTSTSERRTFSIAPHTKGPKTVLKVTFPDGAVIQKHFAAQTLSEVIRKIGYERVSKLNLAANGVPLISTVKDNFYNQHSIGNGILVMTHTPTRVKKDLLDEISSKLGLGLQVDIVPRVQ